MEVGSPVVRSPWAKIEIETGDFHHLAHHCADVAACFECIVSLPTFQTRIERVIGCSLSPVLIGRLSVLVFLHDAGKLHPGFQAKGWQDRDWHGERNGHVSQGAAIFSEYKLFAK